MSNIKSGSVMQLESMIGPATFIVFGPELNDVVDPVYGRRIRGLWVSHFDKAYENTEGWVWESILTSKAWVNIASSPESRAVYEASIQV